MVRQLLAIARNTFTESIRQPIFTVLTLVAGVALVLNVSLAAYSMETGGGNEKILVDMGLSTVFITGVLLAAFSATGVLSSEIEKRTVLTVVSKPVPRPVFVIGKYLGVAAALVPAYLTLACVFLATWRHGVLSTASDTLDGPVLAFCLLGAAAALGLATVGNYFFNWVFTSTLIKALAVGQFLALLGVLVVSKDWQLQSPLAEFQHHEGKLTQLVVGLGMIFEAILVLTAVAIAVSTRVGQVMTLLLCTGVFFVGIISNSLSGWVNDSLALPSQTTLYASLNAVFTADVSLLQKTAFTLAKVLYLVLPNLQFFWPADAITQGHSLMHDLEGDFTLSVVGLVSLYAGLYIVVVLGLATALFQRREVG